jgi:hypothetical protein
MKRSPLVVIENATHCRAIIQDHVARRVWLWSKGCRQLLSPRAGRFRIALGVACFRRSAPMLQEGLFDLPQATHLAPHLNLGVTVRRHDRLGHIAQEMVVTIAMRDAREFRRNPRHEGILFVRDPQHDRLVQALRPALGLGDQPSDFVSCRGEQRRGEPDAFAGQFADDGEGLVPLLGLQAVDRQDDLLDRFVVLSQGLGVLLPGGEHRLVTLDVLGDGIVGERDRVGVPELGSDQGDREVAGTPAMPDPAEDVPADSPVWRGDRGFEFGALGLGVSRAVRIGAMVELADQLHRTLQGMNAAVPVVADVHHPATDRTGAIEDIEFPEGEIGIRRPVVGHRAGLHVMGRTVESEAR